MTKEISQLPPSTGIEDTDLFATKKGPADYRATAEQVSDYTLGNLSGQDVMDKILNVDSNSSGLNSNFLQGEDKSFFQNAANLISGLVPEARLPSGSFSTNATFPNVRNIIKIPEFLLGGERVMIQFGRTGDISEGGLITLTFPEAFVSGYGTENEPIILVTPECQGDSITTGPTRVELDIRLYERTLSYFRVASVRTGGSGTDQVKAHYIAIGRY